MIVVCRKETAEAAVRWVGGGEIGDNQIKVEEEEGGNPI